MSSIRVASSSIICVRTYKKTPSYLTRPRVENQYFRQKLWIFVESSLAKLFVFLTIYVSHSQIITRLWCILYKLLLPDLSKNSTFILKNLAIYSIFASIFDLRLSNSSSIHQFYYSASIRLRSQTFSIRLNDESWVRIPLCRYLKTIFLDCFQTTSFLLKVKVMKRKKKKDQGTFIALQ